MLRPLSPTPLSVVPNPFSAPLDHEGRPSGVTQYDPEHVGRGTVRHVGATVVRDVVLQRAAYDGRASRRAVRIEYALAPTAVVDTEYHRRAVRSGELLAADAETWTRCLGPKAPPFEAPASRLAAARAAAVREWELQTGRTVDVNAWPAGCAADEQPPAPAPAAGKSKRKDAGGDA